MCRVCECVCVSSPTGPPGMFLYSIYYLTSTLNMANAASAEGGGYMPGTRAIGRGFASCESETQ